jgi:hypothetical protein
MAGIVKLLPPDLDPEQVSEFLLSLGGPRIRDCVYLLSDQLRRAGYVDAAAKWQQIADLMGEMIEEAQLVPATRQPI